MRQHLAAVQAAAEVSGAELTGAVLGSTDLTFRPGATRSGDYSFRIGTAGSTTLILQTVLPALMVADQPSTIQLVGGTHNPLAPPFDFLERVYLPLINRMGPHVSAVLVRPGFYPAGGGEFNVAVRPSRVLQGFDLVERGELRRHRVQALLSRLPAHIGQRESQTIAAASGWPDSCFEIIQVQDARGPGNVVMIELVSEHVTELFTGFGEKGIRAEDVAQRTWERTQEYLVAGVPVGPDLADQLLLPLGLSAQQGSGGSFRTMALSEHSRTHIDILQRFLDITVRVEERASDDVLITLHSK
jgi:RNA 3'-terminal phosphate cyclase (ATP)